jgi:hypothetical protein
MEIKPRDSGIRESSRLRFHFIAATKARSTDTRRAIRSSALETSQTSRCSIEINVHIVGRIELRTFIAAWFLQSMNFL